MEPITHTTASGLSFREISQAVNIEQHKMLTSARQLWFYHLAIKPRRGARIESIKQHAWNFGRAVPFACPQTTEGGDCSKRRNEENDDNNLKESQRPARKDL
jgi:hypothetical protein